jgi:uncharacterized membrane protein YuzA (DUF378 family)
MDKFAYIGSSLAPQLLLVGFSIDLVAAILWRSAAVVSRIIYALIELRLWCITLLFRAGTESAALICINPQKSPTPRLGQFTPGANFLFRKYLSITVIFLYNRYMK